MRIRFGVSDQHISGFTAELLATMDYLHQTTAESIALLAQIRQFNPYFKGYIFENVRKIPDIGNPADQDAFAQQCLADLQYSQTSDGSFLEHGLKDTAERYFWNLGYIPVNPRTGVQWTDQEVRDALVTIVNKVRTVTGKPMVLSGIIDGDNYLHKEAIYNSMFVAIPADSIIGVECAFHDWVNSSWFSESTWLNGLNMLTKLQNLGEKADINTGTLFGMPPGTTAKQMIEFTYCSYMLAFNSDLLSTELAMSPQDYTDYFLPITKVDYGNAVTNAYVISGTHVYARDFQKTKILVNPTETAYMISLDGKYKMLDGTEVESVTVEPHTGMVLLSELAPPPAPILGWILVPIIAGGVLLGYLWSRRG